MKQNRVSFSAPAQNTDVADNEGPPASTLWMNPLETAQQPVVTGNELTSLSALIAYVAFKSGRSEFQIERGLSDRFNVPNVTRLPVGSYETAVRYLVDSIDYIKAV